MQTNKVSLFEPDELVTTKQLACRTNLSDRYWELLRFKGNGPKFFKPSTRCVRYKWRDVVEWLESHHQVSASEYLR